jgi:hypothetical protein
LFAWPGFLEWIGGWSRKSLCGRNKLAARPGGALRPPGHR